MTRLSRPDLRYHLFPVLAAVAIYGGHLWFGANSTFGALLLVSAEALLLCGIITSGLKPPARLARGALAAATGLFALLLALLALSATSAGLGGVHPLWTYVAAPGAVAIDRSAVLIEIAKLLGLAAMFIVGAVLSSSKATARSMRRCLVWGGGVFATIGLLLHLNRGGADPRLTANLTSANCAATVFAVLICLALSGLFEKRREVTHDPLEAKILTYAPSCGLLLLFASCLVLTASRAGLAVAVVSVSALLTIHAIEDRLRLRAAAVLLIALGGGLIAILMLKGGLAVERFGSIIEKADPRAVMFDAAWRTFLQSPLGGYGIGSFAEVNRLTLAAPTYGETWSGRDLHNVYLQWMLEAGLPGAALMFASIGIILFVIILGRSRMRSNRMWLAALLCADAAVLLHSTSDFALQVPSISAMWSLLLGIQVGVIAGPIGPRVTRRHRAATSHLQTEH